MIGTGYVVSFQLILLLSLAKVTAAMPEGYASIAKVQANRLAGELTIAQPYTK